MQPPSEGDVYRVYLNPTQRGYCKLAERPRVRRSRPCGQMAAWLPDEAQAVDAVPTPSKFRAVAPVEVNGKPSCPDGTAYDAVKCGSPGGMQVAGVDVAYKYPDALGADAEGGAMCGDDEVCIAVDKYDKKTKVAAPPHPR